jgi:hypothetical protein
MLAYAGALAGAGAYLVARGGCPRSGAVPWSRERALFLLRVSTGATFLWCGVYYKLLQPNLVLAIVADGGVPTFGLGPEAFVFGMALVEVSAGALMMARVLVAPMALALPCSGRSSSSAPRLGRTRWGTRCSTATWWCLPPAAPEAGGAPPVACPSTA